MLLLLYGLIGNCGPILRLFVFVVYALTISSRVSAQTDAQFIAAEKQKQTTSEAMAKGLERQRASIGRQRPGKADRENVSASPSAESWFLTETLLSSSPSSEDCEPLSILEVQSLSDRAAKMHRVSPELVRAVMKQESAFRPCAVSSAGAVGLMQLMPETAAELGVENPGDAEQNVFGGAKLLRKLLDRYAGNLNLTLGAYNAGPAAVDRADGIPHFAETINYVDRITAELTRAR